MLRMSVDGSAAEQFGEMAKIAAIENVVPRMKDVHANEENVKPEDILKLGSLEVGDELTLEFYPQKNAPEPKPIRISVTEVREKGVSGLASGGNTDAVDMEVSVSSSSVSQNGSMARIGEIQIGFYPEIMRVDLERKDKIREIILGKYDENGGIISPS